MKKGQEPGQLDKEAVGRITCRILQEEEPGGMLVKKLWRLAGMLICLLCLTGGLCSAFLSGFGIRYLVPVFWILLIVSVLFWIGFSRLPLEGVYRLLAILGTLIGVSLFLLLLQKDVIAGYMSAVNGVRSRLNETYDGTLALYQASASAMQMTVFFGFILFLLAGLLSAGICYRTNPAVVLAGEFPVLAGIGIAGGTPSFFSFFLILLGTLGMLSAAAVSRADQRDQDGARQARQMTEQMKSSVNVCLLLQAVVLSLLAFVLVRPLTNTLLQAQEAGMKTQNGVLQAVWQLLPAVSGGRLKLSVEGVGGGVSDGTLTDQDGFYFGKVQALKVTVSEKPSETVYLKGFIGTDYTGTAFEEADGESFVQAASLWKLDGNVSLGVENLPFLRTYYAENVVFTGEGDDAKPELSANAASSAVTLQVENLAANPNYTYVPYGAFFNDYYQVLGGDGALAGQSVQQDIFSCYPRKQLEETLEDWNETKQQESTLDQAESAYAAYVQAHCSSLPENLSFLQEKFDLDLETKESADPKEAEKNWEKIDDLAQVYVRWGAHVYGDGENGAYMPDLFKRRLSRIDATVMGIDNREINLLSADDFNSYHGGLIAGVRSCSGKMPRTYCADSTDQSHVVVRTIEEEVKRVFRGEIMNPKFINGMKEHGYKGAADMGNYVAHCYQWDATSDVMDDWMYEDLAVKYALDPEIRQWMEEVNPWALHRIAEVLLEAEQRQMWNAKSKTKKELQKLLLDIEGEIEERAD